MVYQVKSRLISDFSIFMSTADQRTWYPLHIFRNDMTETCVSTYTIYSGPNNPFEYIKMVLTKQDMAKMAPDLKTIEPGKNLLSVNAVGGGQYTVTSCKYSNKQYTITAYINADKIRRYTYESSQVMTPIEHIRYILSTGKYGVRYDEAANSGSLLKFDGCEEYPDKITIPKGTEVWTALQMCAMLIGCRIFFAEGIAYVVGWNKAPEDNTFMDFDMMSGAYRLLGNVNQGNVGSNSIVNYISAQYNSGSNSTSTLSVCGARLNDESDSANLVYTYEPAQQSENYYYRREGGVYDLTLLDKAQAKKWLENYLDYTVESQVDVSFKLNENFMISGALTWKPVFTPYECITRVRCSSDEVDIDNVSSLTGEANPKILLLSAVERSYPEGYSEYTFGQMKSISLSNSTSEIYSSLGTKMTNITK